MAFMNEGNSAAPAAEKGEAEKGNAEEASGPGRVEGETRRGRSETRKEKEERITTRKILSEAKERAAKAIEEEQDAARVTVLEKLDPYVQVKLTAARDRNKTWKKKGYGPFRFFLKLLDLQCLEHVADLAPEVAVLLLHDFEDHCTARTTTPDDDGTAYNYAAQFLDFVPGWLAGQPLRVGTDEVEDVASRADPG